MSDPNLYVEENGGDLLLDAGDLLVGNGLISAASLSLFGGNTEDSGTGADAPKQFWGNRLYKQESRHLRSRSGHLLEFLPVTSGNLKRLEEAAAEDLQWMVDENIVSDLSVVVSFDGPKRVRYDLSAVVSNEKVDFSLTREWGGSL